MLKLRHLLSVFFVSLNYKKDYMSKFSELVKKLNLECPVCGYLFRIAHVSSEESTLADYRHLSCPNCPQMATIEEFAKIKI
jgi:hypothetical protein